MNIYIDPESTRPIYKQLTDQIENAVHSGILSAGEHIPSMNDLASEKNISRETVKKAYGILSDKGIIIPRQGKGFYIAGQENKSKMSVLVLFDKISIYKQDLFNSFASELGSKAECTILTHNQSLDLFKYYLDSYLDDFDYYVVTPHFPLDEESQRIARKLISRIPNRKLIMVDRLQPKFPGNYGAVYQDFEHDVYHCLSEGLDKLKPGSRLKVVTLPESLYGSEVCKGVEVFCREHSISVEYFSEPPETIVKGDTFLVLNSQLDSGLAALARRIREAKLHIGRDVYIISSNEFDLNEVVLGGLTTVSADFKQMGRLAARMIRDHRREKIHCDFRMTRRNTF